MGLNIARFSDNLWSIKFIAQHWTFEVISQNLKLQTVKHAIKYIKNSFLQGFLKFCIVLFMGSNIFSSYLKQFWIRFWWPNPFHSDTNNANFLHKLRNLSLCAFDSGGKYDLKFSPNYNFVPFLARVRLVMFPLHMATKPIQLTRAKM